MSCRNSTDSTAGNPDIEKRFFQHDSVLTYKLFGDEITTAEKSYLYLQVTSSEEQSVTFPQPGEKLGRFTVSRVSPVYRERTGLDTGPHNVITAINYELEPFLEGTYTVPRLEIVLEHTGTGEETLFLTDEQKVSVRPLLTEHEAREIATTGKAVIKDIIIPESSPGGIIALVSGALILVGAAVGFVLLKRKRREPDRPAETSIEVQLIRELERTLKKRLPEQGRYMEYFIQLSNILRKYIEVRSGIRATEKTTEEFLKDMASHSTFREREKLHIEEFLNVSDIVKFGAHEPSTEEVGRAAEICRTIIHSSHAVAARSVTGGESE
jgi:hypothetical protein